MSLKEQAARALLTLRDTFGGPTALRFWESLAGGAEGAKAVPNLKSLKAAFTASWEGATKGPLTKKGQVRGARCSPVAFCKRMCCTHGRQDRLQPVKAIRAHLNLACRKGRRQKGSRCCLV
jgi:hypothetical protein